MIIIGEGSYTGNEIKTRFEDCDIIIGRYCSIALNLTVYTGGNHHADWITTYPFSTRMKQFKSFGPHQTAGRPVVIGNDVWIGDDVTIMSGVTVGNGACIGTRSIVRSDVEPYSIVRGNPARLIKKRFTDEEILLLQEMKWWNWEFSFIQEAMRFMLSSDVNGLYQFYKKRNINNSGG